MEDGGPAFPRPASVDTTQGTLPDGDSVREDQEGMTLRDYFAAKIIHGLATPTTGDGDPTQWNWDELAKCAYAGADAMISAREN